MWEEYAVGVVAGLGWGFFLGGTFGVTYAFFLIREFIRKGAIDEAKKKD